MGCAVWQVDFNGFYSACRKLGVREKEIKAHEKGISQYSANIVAIMLMTISLHRSARFSPDDLQLRLVRSRSINEDIFRLPSHDFRVCIPSALDLYQVCDLRCELMMGGIDRTRSFLSYIIG